ncbi:hypothetical protein Ancab_025641 [Ancistrocladus abbreviatus]
MEEIFQESSFDNYPQKCASFSFRRSRSSVLFYDSTHFESARFVAYGPLSKPLRLTGDESPIREINPKKRRTTGAWEFLRKAFRSFRKPAAPAGEIVAAGRKEEGVELVAGPKSAMACSRLQPVTGGVGEVERGRADGSMVVR